jgi:transcriptional regulator with XRE-family HTH domain
MSKVSEAMRAAIQRSGQSAYRIAKGAGVSASQLSRLASGEREVSLATLERLADYLGLELVLRPARRKRKAT